MENFAKAAGNILVSGNEQAQEMSLVGIPHLYEMEHHRQGLRDLESDCKPSLLFFTLPLYTTYLELRATL